MSQKRHAIVGRTRAILISAWKALRCWLADRRRDLASWSLSLSVHAGILLLLSLLVWSIGPQDDARTLLARIGKDDLTGVPDLDRGTPFFDEVNDDVSLPVEAIDNEVINAPQLPAGGPIEREVALMPSSLTELEPGRSVGRPGPAAMRIAGGSLAAPFSGRQSAMKAKLLMSEGGSPESEAAVARGLEWLARHQAADGRWSLDCSGQCRKQPGCPPGPSMQSDTAATGLALLPFLAAGHSHLEPGEYRATIERGVSWLVRSQQASGELFAGGSGTARFYSHAIATMALCEAYGVSHDPRLKIACQKAIDFTAKTQNSLDGGWRYQPSQPGDTSVFGWQMMALRSANLTGIRIPDRVIRGCRRYLDAAKADPTGATYAYQPGRAASPVMTAEALLCRQYLGWKKSKAAMAEGATQVLANLRATSSRNIYYWYYATQMLHNLGGPAWQEWNSFIRDGLINTQTLGASCDTGSWEPVGDQPDAWGRSAGRHFTTCLSLLTLEVYYRYLPLYKQVDGNATGGETSDDDPKEKVGES